MAPLVRIAWDYHRGEPPAKPAENPFKNGGLTEENYRKAVEQTISAQYAASAGTKTSMLADQRDGLWEGFSESDVRSALGIFDALLGQSLLAESATGGGPQAIARVAAAVPGLPADLYAEVMSWVEYKNH